MKSRYEVTSAGLHVFAMVTMLVDHLYHVFSGPVWMNYIGRLSFPVFCFMLVEGYFYTSNLSKYLMRMFVTAIVAEIPFDMAFFGQPFYWGHQNVIWTFLVVILLIHLWETAKKTDSFFNYVCAEIVIVLVAYATDVFLHTDYGAIGVFTVLLFYVTRNRVWWNYLFQFAGMLLMHLIFGSMRQGFAVLALIPIWLYQGRQGFHKKWFQYVCYLFYPLHLFVLGLYKLV